MKKALAGPAKRTAKKKPERRAMIAATRRRIRAAASRAHAASRRLDRAADRALARAWPPLARLGRRGRRFASRAARRLRPLAALAFHLLGRLERVLLRARELALRAGTRGSAVLTPERATCLAIVVAAACLGASQFVDYRAVEVGGPGYAGLSGASAPTVAARTAGEAHAFLLLPVAALAAALALVVLRNGRRRGLGRGVFALGLLSLAVALLVDLPAGLDVGTQASRFSGATAVLLDGFYAEVAAAAGLTIGGLLLSNAHGISTRHGYRPRKSSLARTQGGRRRARTSSA
jgi:hypothetical protein